ncbi:MAG: cytochrome C oxidase subunit IV family protein [Chloroflexi bacterium]|nr:cytochrome C oxidase subunit IV family protein [Chloroflexota bacterium]
MESTTHKHAHPNYMMIGLMLIILTAFEVGVVLLPIVQWPFLLLFGIAKALLITAFFMHLRFDAKIYLILFALPFPLAVLLMLIQFMS